jgi:hypothetical protein
MRQVNLSGCSQLVPLCDEPAGPWGRWSRPSSDAMVSVMDAMQMAVGFLAALTALVACSVLPGELVDGVANRLIDGHHGRGAMTLDA